jgi:hypothetical protein
VALREVGTKVVNPVIFRRGWTVTVRRSDQLAPKRTTVIKSRFPSDTAAVVAVHEVEAAIKESGKPPAG